MAVSVGIGALAGLIATMPMTIFMELIRQRLPLQERDALPPRKIALRAARRIGLLKHMDERQRDVATLVTHFGFGAAAGAVYAVLVHLKGWAPPVLRGLGFGFAVWLLSYMGWLPAVGLFRPASRDTNARNVLMIAAHLVWGATVGALVDWCSSVECNSQSVEAVGHAEQARAGSVVKSSSGTDLPCLRHVLHEFDWAT